MKLDNPLIIKFCDNAKYMADRVREFNQQKMLVTCDDTFWQDLKEELKADNIVWDNITRDDETIIEIEDFDVLLMQSPLGGALITSRGD